MKKRRIRYSELGTPGTPPASPPAGAADEGAPGEERASAPSGAARRANAGAEAPFPAADMPMTEPTAPVAASSPTRRNAPLDLARALADARSAEAAERALQARSAEASIHALPHTPPVAGPAVARPIAAAPAAPPPVGGGSHHRAVAPRSTMRMTMTPAQGMRTVPAPGAAEAAAAQAPRELRDRVRARIGRAELLLFRIDRELFGIELAKVEEAIDLPPVRHIPEMPPAMLGVVPVRDMLTPVFSPQDALGLQLSSGGAALVFRRGQSRLAIVVDDVDDVCTLDLAGVRDAPGAELGDGLLLGVSRHRGALLSLVDADALIAACQAAHALETA